MPSLSQKDAIETLATVAEQAKETVLAEVYAELFPDKPGASQPSATELIRHIRAGLYPEEIVDLWNVLFPKDRNVWYDEEEDKIWYNEELSYAE